MLLLKANSQRLKKSILKERKRRRKIWKQRLGDGGKKEDRRDREKGTWKEQDMHRERDEEEALLGCIGV